MHADADAEQRKQPRFRVLGPTEINVDGVTVPLRSRGQRVMLTMLLVAVGRAVGADRLVDALWGERLPDDPAGALRTQASRLRRALPAGAELLTEVRGYRLAVDPDDIDVWRFERLVANARARPDEDALRMLDNALELWRGDPLDEFADLPFAQIEQRRLRELFASACEHRIEILLAAGRAVDVVDAAQPLLADQPERERVRAMLMEALYRLGRGTEALHVYASWRRALAERGLEPAPELREVENRILRHAIDPQPAITPTVRELVDHPRVPRPASSLHGRDTDLRGVADLLREARFVTLWGPGGVGKTRLALEVAAVVSAGYGDGVHVCDLTVLTAGSDVARAIASVVGVRERSGRRLEAQLVDALAGRRLLLVLDNCEHVLDATAIIAQHLVAATSGVDVLTTSRERLGVDGEHLWEVVPLEAAAADSPAVQLFVDRARATNRTFDPSGDELEVVAELCRRLDGLPLALELAASRVRGLSLRELLDTLDVSQDVLRGGAGRPQRHRSLRAVIDWSYSLLTPAEQRVFDCLTVFRTAFTLEAARAVVADHHLAGADVELAVLTLMDRALLVERADGTTRRFVMLDTVRRFGLERLERNGDLNRIAAAHARWVLDQTERASRGLSGADEASSAKTIHRSVDELRAAHRWLVAHDLDAALRLSAALRPYALWRGHSEIFRWAEVAAAAASGTGGRLLAEVLLAASTGAWQRGDLVGAGAAAEAIPGCGPFEDTRRAALEASADVALLRGDVVRAEDEFTEAYRLALEAGDVLQAVWDIASAAVAVAYGGNFARAMHLAQETSVAAERSGSPSARAMAEFVLGELLARSEPEVAQRHLRRAIEYSAIADSRFVAGIAEVALAASRSRQRDLAVALEHCRSAIERWRQVGAWTPLWVTIRTVVALLVRAGELEEAAVLLGAAQSARSGAPTFGSDAEAMLTAEQHLRSTLGDEAFSDLAASARAMTEDEVLQYSISALDRAATHVR